MIVEFDPDKDEANRIKHGVPLLFGIRVFEDKSHIILASFRPVDGEDRFKVVGLVADRLWTAIYVERGDAIRLISVRRSNDGEQGNYDRHCRRSQ